MSKAQGSIKVIVIALLVNLGIALSKFLGAYFSGSSSMLAESIHSLVDCSNQLLLLWGSKAANRPADKIHPLGYGKESFFWSFVVAILLFSMGGLFSIYEGFHKLGESEVHLSALWISFVILLFSICLESFSFYACLKEVRERNPYGSIWTWIHKGTNADLLVIFLEDAAALAGLVIAAIFIAITWLTGNPWWDAVGSIAIGLLLITSAAVLGFEMKSLLIGEGSSLDLQTPFAAEMTRLFPDSKIFHFIALQVGGDQIMVSCKFHPGDLSLPASELITKMNTLERNTKAQFPEVRWIFLEPDDAD